MKGAVLLWASPILGVLLGYFAFSISGVLYFGADPWWLYGMDGVIVGMIATPICLYSCSKLGVWKWLIAVGLLFAIGLIYLAALSGI